ncbi:MAG TPA: hypothetical protein VML95_00525 [Longimicrobiales bacterium]|nr:hypothetical protein [Longimicrobiales bacterium]
MSGEKVPVRLVFADRGSFHELEVTLPAALLARRERIIDVLREEEEVLSRLYVDGRRLVAAYAVESEE